MTASTCSRRWHIVKWQTRASKSSQSQLYIAILRLGLLHRFLLQLNLSAGLCHVFWRCLLLLLCFLQSPKQSPVTFPQHAKERLHQCNCLSFNTLPISLHCHCFFSGHFCCSFSKKNKTIKKKLWKSPLVFSFFNNCFVLFFFSWLQASELLITLSLLSSWISPWSLTWQYV